MRTRLINACNQQSNTVWPLAVLLSVCLSSIANGSNDTFKREGTTVGKTGGEGLLLHEVGEDASVRGEAGEGETDVCVNGNNLLLVGGELFCVALEVVRMCDGEREDGRKKVP